MCRYRTRDDDASLFLPPPPCIRLSFARLPHGQRGHVPVAMETGPNRDGNSPPPYSLSPLFSTVARRCSSRCLSSSRIRLVFFLPSSLSLSLLVPRSCRSRSHLSLIRPACQPALSFSSLFSPFPLPVARSR